MLNSLAVDFKQLNVWPPGGTDTKFPRLGGTPVRELVRGFGARAGELVKISPEFQKGAPCSRFAGKLGRVTTSYGEGFVGVLFEGERCEEIFFAGTGGAFQLVYAHGAGTREAVNDVQPPKTNTWGKLQSPLYSSPGQHKNSSPSLDGEAAGSSR